MNPYISTKEIVDNNNPNAIFRITTLQWELIAVGIYLVEVLDNLRRDMLDGIIPMVEPTIVLTSIVPKYVTPIHGVFFTINLN